MDRGSVESYAFFRELCALLKNSYAGSYARVMRIISFGYPLDLDAIDLYHLSGPCFNPLLTLTKAFIRGLNAFAGPCCGTVLVVSSTVERRCPGVYAQVLCAGVVRRVMRTTMAA